LFYVHKKAVFYLKKTLLFREVKSSRGWTVHIAHLGKPEFLIVSRLENMKGMTYLGDIVTRGLKAGIVEPEEKAVGR
jgi:hypothetical protein